MNLKTRQIKDTYYADTGKTLPGGTYTTSFEHDLLGRKRTIYYPNDPYRKSITARYKYSAGGDTAVDVYNPTGKKNILSNISYNEFGQMTRLARRPPPASGHLPLMNGEDGETRNSSTISAEVRSRHNNFLVA